MNVSWIQAVALVLLCISITFIVSYQTGFQSGTSSVGRGGLYVKKKNKSKEVMIMPICYKCGQESYIKYGNHFVCSKHYNLAVNEVFNKVVENSVGVIQHAN